MFGLVLNLSNSSALVGSSFGAIWEEPEGGFIKFAVKRALKQDQTLHMEGKLHVILYFMEEFTQQTIKFKVLCKKHNFFKDA